MNVNQKRTLYTEFVFDLSGADRFIESIILARIVPYSLRGNDIKIKDWKNALTFFLNSAKILMPHNSIDIPIRGTTMRKCTFISSYRNELCGNK